MTQQIPGAFVQEQVRKMSSFFLLWTEKEKIHKAQVISFLPVYFKEDALSLVAAEQ